MAGLINRMMSAIASPPPVAPTSRALKVGARKFGGDVPSLPVTGLGSGRWAPPQEVGSQPAPSSLLARAGRAGVKQLPAVVPRAPRPLSVNLAGGLGTNSTAGLPRSARASYDVNTRARISNKQTRPMGLGGTRGHIEGPSGAITNPNRLLMGSVAGGGVHAGSIAMAGALGGAVGGYYTEGGVGGAVRGAIGGAVLGAAAGHGIPALMKHGADLALMHKGASQYSGAISELGGALNTSGGRRALFAGGGMLGGAAFGGRRDSRRGFNKNRGSHIGR